MYKIEPIETENLKLMPGTSLDNEYALVLHRANSYSIMDDTDRVSGDNFRNKINQHLNTDTFGWSIWLKKYTQKVGIIYYTHVIPNFSAIMHPVLDKEGFRKYLSKCNGDPRVKFMDEASAISLKYVMKKFNLVKITGGFFEHNLPAINLCKRLGFKEDGIMRHDAIHEGKLINVKVLSILKEEVL